MIRVDGTWEEHEEALKREAFEDGIEAGKAEGIELGKAEGIELVLSNLHLSEEEMIELRSKLANK